MLLPYFVKNFREVKFGRYYDAWVKIDTTLSRENLQRLNNAPLVQNIMVRNELEGSESVDGGSNPYTINQNLTNQKKKYLYKEIKITPL